MKQADSKPTLKEIFARNQIRLTKWLGSKIPAKWLYKILVSRATIPTQTIFIEAFKASDPSKTALDIGANRGLVSYFIARRFSRTHSFEPNKNLVSFLRKVLPSTCTVHDCALSDVQGKTELSVVLEAGIPIHGKGKILNASDSDKDYDVQKIQTETLDSQGISNIGFIKIDVEGHEESVIRGGLKTLEVNKPVLVIEIEKRHSGKPVKESIAFIESLGYTGYFFENGVKHLASDYREEMQEPEYPRYINDFMFLPKAG